jgi:hypothetical protein
MGKKASFKADFSYDDDDIYDEKYSEWDREWDEDEHYVCPHLAARKYVSRRKTTGSGAATSGRRKVSSSVQEDSMMPRSSLSVLPVPSTLRYYKRDGQTSLKMLDVNSILTVARYLPLRSIGALCCSGRFLDELLVSDFLYCRGSQNGNGGGNYALLPCVDGLKNVLTLQTRQGLARKRGLARTFAHEQDRIFGAGVDHAERLRGRSYRVTAHIRCDHEVDNFCICPNDAAIMVITQSCEIEVHWDGGGSSKKGTSASTYRPPSCDYLLKSALRAESRLCALLTTGRGGAGRHFYLISLVRWPRTRSDDFELVLQERLPCRNLYSSSTTRPILDFNEDGAILVFGSTERVFACSSRDGSTTIRPLGGKRSLVSAMVQGSFIFLLQSRSLHAYAYTSAEEPSLLASGCLEDRYQRIESMHPFGGRIWIVCGSHLLCTQRLMRSLKLELASSSARDGGAATTPGRIRFPHSFDLAPGAVPRRVATTGDCLYVASGTLVRAFGRGDVPREALRLVAAGTGGKGDGGGPITSLHADGTKVAIAAAHPNGRSGRIELVPIDPAGGGFGGCGPGPGPGPGPGRPSSSFPSIHVRGTFLSRHVMGGVRCSGSRLAVSYSNADDRGGGSSPSQSPPPHRRGGEIQAFDLLRKA